MMDTNENSLKAFFPPLLGVCFAALQGMTVYFTNSVDKNMESLDRKLEQTWEMTLITKTEVATLKEKINNQQSDLIDLREQNRKSFETVSALQGKLINQ